MAQENLPVDILTRDEVIYITEEHVYSLKELITRSLGCPFNMFWLLFGRDILRVEPPSEVLLSAQFTRPWILDQVRRYQPYAVSWVGLMYQPGECQENNQLYLSAYVEYDEVTTLNVAHHVHATQDEILIRFLQPGQRGPRVLVDFVRIPEPRPCIYSGMLAGVLMEGMQRR
jgi:hypothetical protein